MGTDRRGIQRSIEDRLERRLLRNIRQPLVIGLSGGGDSVALVLIVDAWARAAGRNVILATVDHGLQTESPAWTERCALFAAKLERPFRALSWTGEKPRTGLPAAARTARHRLLADLAREVGATTLLLGHTADDCLESELMRRDGATTPDPREWAPSPAWPEGRGQFILRPMLGLRRRDLRDWLTQRGETWIDDPSNLNLAYARARARRSLDHNLHVERADPPPLALAAQAIHRAGVISLSKAALRQASSADVARFVAMASVSAGGGSRRPAGARIQRAANALVGPEPIIATLAGARLEADDHLVQIFREAGEAGRGGLTAVETDGEQPIVWDGRFEIAASSPGYGVRRLAGLVRCLPPEQLQALRALPPAARGGLPARLDSEGRATCLALSGEALSLVAGRFAAAAGLVDHEPALAPSA